MTTAAERAWSAALDEIEATLHRADSLAVASQGADSQAVAELASVPAVPESWMPPVGLGSIPMSLVPRARRVLSGLTATQDHLDEARSAVATELAHLADAAHAPGRKAVAGAEPPAPRLVDHDA